MVEGRPVHFADGNLFFTLLGGEADQGVNTESGDQDTDNGYDTEYAEDYLFGTVELVYQVG